MRIEEHLTIIPDATDVVLDLSNVVRRSGLCSDRKADLGRLPALIEGLRTFLGDDTVKVHAVTDWSLWRNRDLLTEPERATLLRWIKSGRIEAREGADDRVLEIADVTGAKVVSHDNYKDKHRIFPWIPGNTDRFLGMKPNGAGIRVVAREIPIFPEHQLSSAEEHDLLRAAGLYDRERHLRREPLTRSWRCPEPECPLFGAERTHDQPLPAYRNGKVCCPTHRRPMTDLGPLVRPVQLKVSVSGKVVRRILVTRDEPLIVGRPLLAGYVPPSLLSEISRRHAEVTWDGTKLTVMDLHSSYGVRIKGRKLTPGVPERWNPPDAVALHDKLKLVVSGRHYVFDESPEPPPAPMPGPPLDAQTRVVRVRR